MWLRLLHVRKNSFFLWCFSMLFPQNNHLLSLRTDVFISATRLFWASRSQKATFSLQTKDNNQYFTIILSQHVLHIFIYIDYIFNKINRTTRDHLPFGPSSTDQALLLPFDRMFFGSVAGKNPWAPRLFWFGFLMHLCFFDKGAAPPLRDWT